MGEKDKKKKKNKKPKATTAMPCRCRTSGDSTKAELNARIFIDDIIEISTYRLGHLVKVRNHAIIWSFPTLYRKHIYNAKKQLLVLGRGVCRSKRKGTKNCSAAYNSNKNAWIRGRFEVKINGIITPVRKYKPLTRTVQEHTCKEFAEIDNKDEPTILKKHISKKSKCQYLH